MDFRAARLVEAGFNSRAENAYLTPKTINSRFITILFDPTLLEPKGGIKMKLRKWQSPA